MAGAVLGGMVLLYAGRDLWFFGDEWAFLLDRSLSDVGDWFRPHNEHWSTVPVLIYRLIFSKASLSSHTPYFVTLVALHVTLGAVIGRFLLRAGAPVIVAALVAGGLVTFGPGGENLLWSFQIGFTISLVTAVLAFGLIERADHKSGLAAAALLLVSVASSGVGAAALAAAMIDLLLRRRWERLVVVGGIPTIAYVTWLVLAGGATTDSVASDPLASLLLVPTFVARGLTATFDGLFGLGLSLGFLAVVLVTIAVLTHLLSKRPSTTPLVSSSLLTIVFVLAAAGSTRAVSFGVESAASSRYVHIGGVLITLGAGVAFFQSETWHCHRSGPGRLGLAAVLAISVVANVAILREFAWSRTSLSTDVRNAVEAMAAVLAAAPDGEYIDEARPVPHSPDIDVLALRVGIADGSLRFAPRAVETVSDFDIERMRSLMKTRIAASEPSVKAALVVIGPSNDIVAEAPSEGCISAQIVGGDPYLELRLVTPGWVSVHSVAGGVLEVFPEVDGEFDSSASIQNTIQSDETRWVEVASGIAAIRIDPPVGPGAAICASEVSGSQGEVG